MRIGPSIENFKGEIRNNIKSEGRAYSNRSISFELFEEEDPIILKSGSKIDLNKNGKYVKGTIKEVKMVSEKQISLIINLQGELPISLPYPNSKIKPCGSHVKNRDCRGSLKNYISKQPIMIRFIPKDYPTTGEYLPDYGNVYGKSGKPFGFSRDMSNKVISRGVADKPVLETFIEFPPSPLSRFCNKPNPETNCEPVMWSVWAGPGKFNIKLLLGDVTSDIIIDFTINGKSVAKNLKVAKNKLHILEEVVESKSGFINITSECFENCDFAKSKLNAIEIKPFEKFDSTKNDSNQFENKEKKLPCGEAFEKGRCNTGPNVLHCIFYDKTQPSAAYCSKNLSLVMIPNDYNCKEQIGKYKCVRIEYESEDDCKLYCPKKCKASKCLY